MEDYKAVAYKESKKFPGNARILYFYNPDSDIKVRLIEINEDIGRLKSIFPGVVEVDRMGDVYKMIKKEIIDKF